MRTLLLLVLLGLAACGGTGTGNGCDWARPITVEKADVLSAETARQILAHDRTGAAICGWRPG